MFGSDVCYDEHVSARSASIIDNQECAQPVVQAYDRAYAVQTTHTQSNLRVNPHDSTPESHQPCHFLWGPEKNGASAHRRTP